MNATELRVACALMDWNGTTLARNVGVYPTTPQAWMRGAIPVPGYVEKIVLLSLRAAGWEFPELRRISGNGSTLLAESVQNPTRRTCPAEDGRIDG